MTTADAPPASPANTPPQPKNPARREACRIILMQSGRDQETAARGARLRELR